MHKIQAILTRYQNALRSSFIIKVFLSILLILVLFPLPLQAKKKEKTENLDPNSLILAIGEIRKISLPGQNPFVADADIVSLKILKTQEVIITAVRGGITQLYYYKEGLLQFMDITVDDLQTFQTSGLKARFRPFRPYFNYNIQNNSSFDGGSFYSEPSYAHTISSYIPLGKKGGTLSTDLGYSHTNIDFSEGTLTTSGALYRKNNFYLKFGNDSIGFSQFLRNFSGTSFFGSKASYNFQNSKRFNNEISIFGGTNTPNDIRDFEINKQIYGARYNILMPSKNKSIFTDFGNISFVTYQGDDSDSYRYAGVIEGSYHVSKSIALGLAHAQDNSGFTSSFRPLYETEQSISTAKYSFVRHGLTEFSNTALQYDEHDAIVNTQYLFKDNQSLLTGSIYQNLFIPIDGSSSINSGGGSVSYNHSRSINNSYGASYNISRYSNGSSVSLSNSIGFNLQHSINNISNLIHSVGYGRTDLSGSMNSFTYDAFFDLESTWLRYNASLSTLVITGSTSNQSLNFSQSADFAYKEASLSTGVSYNKNTFSDNNHQFLITQRVNYQPTSVEWLSLSTGLAITAGGASQVSGNIGLTYRRLFGPGVISDSLVKRLFQGGQKSDIEGTVFQDTNYNSLHDANDIPIANARIILDNKKEILTDKKGYFIFKSIKLGEHEIKIAENSLTLPEDPEFIPKQTINLIADQDLTLPMPIHFKRATVKAIFLIDANKNNKADDDDKLLIMNPINVELPSGETKKVYTSLGGGGVIKGLNIGAHKISYDLIGVPANIQPIGSNSQTLTIDEYKEYNIAFLFQATRTIRGQVIAQNEASLPKNMTITYGPNKSKVDDEGFYWIKDLILGIHHLKIENLPAGFCINEDMTQTTLDVGKGAIVLLKNIYITKSCDNTPAISSE
jgi:hypothetical protein